MSARAPRQFRADNPAAGNLPSLGYDLIMFPAMERLKSLICARSARLLASTIGPRPGFFEGGEETEAVQEMNELARSITVPAERRHEHHHLLSAIETLSASAARDRASASEELRSLRDAWRDLQRAEVVPGTLVDLGMCCGAKIVTA